MDEAPGAAADLFAGDGVVRIVGQRAERLEEIVERGAHAAVGRLVHRRLDLVEVVLRGAGRAERARLAPPGDVEKDVAVALDPVGDAAPRAGRLDLEMLAGVARRAGVRDVLRGE